MFCCRLLTCDTVFVCTGLGAKITGVDDKTYSSTGEAFSTVLLPNSESHTAKKLQADDVSLAYEVRLFTEPFLTLRPLLTPRLCLARTVFEEVPGLY